MPRTKEPGLVVIDQQTQERLGLRTITLVAAEMRQEMKGYGRVLETATLAALVTELFTAQAVSAASEAELKRLQTLITQNNVSERALQGAEAAAARDRWQVQSARQKLTGGWGDTIASRQDLATFAQSLTALENALVQVDLPGGEKLSSVPANARLVTLAGEKVQAQLISPAPTVDPQAQGQAFIFLVNPNKPRLAPGMAVMAFLELPGDPLRGVVVPESAVVRHEGAAWVFVRVDGTRFRRDRVALDRPVEKGWFITTGLKLDDVLVSVGAQMLLSEELKSQIRLGD